MDTGTSPLPVSALTSSSLQVTNPRAGETASVGYEQIVIPDKKQQFSDLLREFSGRIKSCSMS